MWKLIAQLRLFASLNFLLIDSVQWDMQRTKIRFTISQLMLMIAAIAIEVGVLPTPLGIFAAVLTVIMPFVLTNRRWGLMVLCVVCFVCVGLLSPVISTSCRSGKSNECASNLRQVSLALQQYCNAHGCYPPAYVADANGKPLYSWRVLVLPYLDHVDLYNAFNFREAWDSPNNLAISNTVINVLTCPQGTTPPYETNYLAITGPGTAFPGNRRVTAADFRDGTANTIVLVEVANAKVHWAQPADLDIATMSLKINDPKRLGISTVGKRGASVAFADSWVTHLQESLSSQKLKALLTINGGEKVDVKNLK